MGGCMPRTRFATALICYCSLTLATLDGSEAPVLTLKETVAETLRYQWAVMTSELSIDSQAGLLQQATGAFDPFLSANFSKLFQKDIQTALGVKSNQSGRTTFTDGSIQTLARLGTTYGVSYANTNIFNPIIPPRTDQSTLNFNVTQPLMRNLLYSPQTTLEKTQGMQLRAVKLQNVQNIAQAVFNTINAYWSLVAAKKALNVQRDQEERLCRLEEYAEELVRENQEGYATLYQPRADLALQTANRIQAEQNVISAYNTLLFNMGYVPDDKREMPDLILEDFNIPEDICVLGTEWYDKYLAQIPEMRTDIQAAKVQIEIANLNLISAKNSLLPELDLNGVVGLLNTTSAQRAKEVFESSSFHDSQKNYTVGVTFTFPLFDNTARGLVKQQRAAKSQAIVNENFLESQIVSDFKTAYTFYNALLAEVKRVRHSAYEYRNTVSAELLKLREGLSDYFVVLQLETNWLQAELQLIQTEMLFVQNIAQIQLLTGKLIDWGSLEKEVETEDVILTIDMFRQAPCETMKEEPSGSCDWLPERPALD